MLGCGASDILCDISIPFNTVFKGPNAYLPLQSIQS